MKTILIAVLSISIIFSVSCSEAAHSEGRWVLLSAPKLLPKECDAKEPCTGTVYVRAALSDWENHGEFATFQQCGAAIWAPKSDSNESLHKQGKLSSVEKMIGFRCISKGDKRLLDTQYDWEKDSLRDEP